MGAISLVKVTSPGDPAGSALSANGTARPTAAGMSNAIPMDLQRLFFPTSIVHTPSRTPTRSNKSPLLRGYRSVFCLSIAQPTDFRLSLRHQNDTHEWSRKARVWHQN